MEIIINELIALADREQLRIESSISDDSLHCLGLFVESVRVLDFIMLGQPGASPSDKISFSAFDISMVETGWNLATSMLLKEVNFHGFPMRQSTAELRKGLISLLYQLGIVIQIRRTVEMIKTGLINVDKEGDTYTFSHTLEAKDQFLDQLELGAFERMEEKLKSSGAKYKEWNLVNRKEIKNTFWKTGNFMSVKHESDFSSYKIQDLDSHLTPLIKQWNSGKYGIMMGYDSTPKVDDHFLAIAAELTKEWRDESGINPNAKIGNVSAAEIMNVAMIVVSFHLKHIHFAQLASKISRNFNSTKFINLESDK
ncbi:MAG: hypothetical protein IPP72_12810 [Chitinophagaceae bacterium]|nr:hypothetical protein [Chitinophagaceae bacterium]